MVDGTILAATVGVVVHRRDLVAGIVVFLRLAGAARCACAIRRIELADDICTFVVVRSTSARELFSSLFLRSKMKGEPSGKLLVFVLRVSRARPQLLQYCQTDQYFTSCFSLELDDVRYAQMVERVMSCSWSL